jgi:subtilisin
MYTVRGKALRYVLASLLTVMLLSIPANAVSTGSQVLLWGLYRTNTDKVHQFTRGEGVKIAILDTGVDLNHPDLRVAGSISFVPGSSADDNQGHGTLVAGIISALDNGMSTIGVAPEAEIYAVKVLNEYGSGAISVIQSGMEWAMQNHMDIIFLGMGSAMEWPLSVQDVMRRAYDAGILLVAGAGNGGAISGNTESIWAPARYEPVIAIGAIDELNHRIRKSSTGEGLELVAPGLNIYSTALDGGYGMLSNTSAAAAYVTGVAALVIATSGLSNVEVRNILQETAVDLGPNGWDKAYGYGLVNAYDSVNKARVDSTSARPTLTAWHHE